VGTPADRTKCGIQGGNHPSGSRLCTSRHRSYKH
jgi:hypothetical protein